MSNSPLGPVTYRPGSFLHLDEQQLRSELDRAMQYIFGSHATLGSTAVVGPVSNAGFTAQHGTAVTNNGSVTGVVTGLKTVQHIQVTLNSAGVASNTQVTARVNPTNAGNIDIYTSQPTAAGNTTPIFTTGLVTVFWWVTGTPVVANT